MIMVSSVQNHTIETKTRWQTQKQNGGLKTKWWNRNKMEQ